MMIGREDRERYQEWCTVREVANLLGVTEMTVYRWIWAGRLPAVRIRGTRLLRVPKHAVLAMLSTT